jgi:hypothetical protein
VSATPMRGPEWGGARATICLTRYTDNALGTDSRPLRECESQGRRNCFLRHLLSPTDAEARLERPWDSLQPACWALVSCADPFRCSHSRTAIDEESTPIDVDSSRTVGPENAKHIEPLAQSGAKPARAGILDRAKLVCEAVRSEERNGLLPCSYKASVSDPHEQIQCRGCSG